MPKKYYLIQGNNWGNKIHIIFPMQLNSNWNKNTNLDLSKKYDYSGWCKTDVKNGSIKKTENISNQEISKLCQDCINDAKKSPLPTPHFIKSLELNTTHR